MFVRTISARLYYFGVPTSGATELTSLNLILKFKLAGDAKLHVKGATRIKVDGLGNLLLCDAQSGTMEKIELKKLETFQIHSITNFGTREPMLAMAVA